VGGEGALAGGAGFAAHPTNCLQPAERRIYHAKSRKFDISIDVTTSRMILFRAELCPAKPAAGKE
jgi:hypothetical protein